MMNKKLLVTYNIINSQAPFFATTSAAASVHDLSQCYPPYFISAFLFGLISLDCGVMDDFVSTVIYCDTNESGSGELIRMRLCKEALLWITINDIFEKCFSLLLRVPPFRPCAEVIDGKPPNGNWQNTVPGDRN